MQPSQPPYTASRTDAESSRENSRVFILATSFQKSETDILERFSSVPVQTGGLSVIASPRSQIT